MAAVVAGLARLLQPAMLLPGGEGSCRDLGPWYLLLGLRLVALFVADGPWSPANPDLACNWTKLEVEVRLFCGALCYNQHFSTPISSSWGFAFLVSLFPVGLMGFIRAGCKPQKKATRGAELELKDPIGESHSKAAGFTTDTGTTPPTSTVISGATMDLPESKTSCRCSWPSMAFSFCVVLLLATELCFFLVVTFLQVPSVSKTTFLCLPRAETCPKALECVLAGQADKEMALWALAFTAFVNIFACLVYLLVRLGRASQCQRRKHRKQNQV